MPSSKKLLAALLSGCIVLLACSGSASASGIGISPAGGITMRSVGSLTFTGAAIQLHCAMTLSGSLDASTDQTAGDTLGDVGSGTLTGCGTGVTGSVTTAGPSLLTYSNFTGTLPSITSLGFRLNSIGIAYATSSTGTCAYSTTIGLIFTPPNAVALDSGNSWARTSGGALCPVSYRVAGAFTISPGQALSVI